jgi:hypothetical protein
MDPQATRFNSTDEFLDTILGLEPQQNGEGEFSDLDVNQDRVVAPSDALIVINELNRFTVAVEVEGESTRPKAYKLDVNNDGAVTHFDVLKIVNYLNRFLENDLAGTALEGLAEGEAPDETPARPIVMPLNPKLTHVFPRTVATSRPSNESDRINRSDDNVLQQVNAPPLVAATVKLRQQTDMVDRVLERSMGDLLPLDLDDCLETICPAINADKSLPSGLSV